MTGNVEEGRVTYTKRLEDVSTRGKTNKIDVEFGDCEDHRGVLILDSGAIYANFFRWGVREHVGSVKSNYEWRHRGAVLEVESQVSRDKKFSIMVESYGNQEKGWEGHATLIICMSIPAIAGYDQKKRMTELEDEYA